jgi:hypothetical protein
MGTRWRRSCRCSHYHDPHACAPSLSLLLPLAGGDDAEQEAVLHADGQYEEYHEVYEGEHAEPAEGEHAEL